VPRPSTATARKPSFWEERWENLKTPLGAFFEDIVLGLVTILGLSAIYLCLGLLAGLGYSAERIERLETIHYWIYLAVYAVLLLDLLIQMALHVIRGWKK
jgi:hypothetical protein